MLHLINYRFVGRCCLVWKKNAGSRLAQNFDLCLFRSFSFS